MGMELVVAVPAQATIAWPALRASLTQCGLTVSLRMIDGELALPDEQPPDDWRELRLGLPAGMVTLARSPEMVRCVVWGNADNALQQQWRTLAHTVAQLCHGTVEGLSDESC